MKRQYIKIEQVYDPEFERLKLLEGSIGYIDITHIDLKKAVSFHVTTHVKGSVEFYETFLLENIKHSYVHRYSTTDEVMEFNSEILKNWKEEFDL